MNTRTFSHLLSVGRIGSMELRNRIVVTAMGLGFAEDDGSCGERIIRYHEEQAKGGAGLIISGAAGVAWPVAAVQPNQIAVSDDKYIAGIRAVADAVHEHGAKFAIQLHHGGLVAGYGARFGHPLWCPSIPQRDPGAQMITDAFTEDEILRADKSFDLKSIQFKEMTPDDIDLVIRQHVNAAVRAKEAGCDGLELNAGHGYLLSSFLNPRTNHRTDRYGGSLDNRIRFLLQVVREVRKAVGSDFPFWVKIDSRQIGTNSGIVLEDALQSASMIEQAGADAITVSAYHDTGKLIHHSDSFVPCTPNWNVPAASRMKKAVTIPIIALGRVEPEVADSEIASGNFDFIAMGRKILADPHLPRKLAEGHPEKVRPCIYCYTCVSCIYLQDSARCAVNPELASEYKTLTVAPGRKHFVVVGGGPGGMEAARRLDELGHKVTLLERSDRLGGTLQFAALAFEPNERLLKWLRRGIENSKVEVRLNTEATPEIVTDLKPDGVLVATGGLRRLPKISGADQPYVFSGDDLRNLIMGNIPANLANKVSLPTRIAARIGQLLGLNKHIEFLRRITHVWMPLGKHVVIIGGSLVGLEVAEMLSERGRKVTIIDESSRMGSGLQLVRRMRIIEELKLRGVSMFTDVKNVHIEANRVFFLDNSGKERKEMADHVIVAQGATGSEAVAERLREAGLKVRAFGDSVGIGYIEGAIRGAADAVADFVSEKNGSSRNEDFQSVGNYGKENEPVRIVSSR